MKALLLFLSCLIAIALVTGNVQAQANNQIASNDPILTSSTSSEPETAAIVYKAPKLTEDGILRDTNNIVLGSVTPNGTLKNSSGVALGKIVQNNKDRTMYDFYNTKGKIVATVGPHGIVKDMSGKILYIVEEPDANGYCNVFDAKNRMVGTVHVSRRHEGACLIHYRKKSA